MEPTEIKQKIHRYLEDNYSYQANELTDTTDLLDEIGRAHV